MTKYRGREAVVVGTFLLLAFVAFGPALRAPFDFDDGPAITGNSSLRQLWPPSSLWERPPSGSAASGRPVVNLSFALNYALNRRLGVAQSPDTESASQTVGFHVVNVLLHVLASILIFALIRRTMRLGRIPEAWRESAEWIAPIVAGAWLLHPIQTEAVDYVSQRTELLVSVFYLLTLYAAIRAWPPDASRERQHARSADNRSASRWAAVAVASCVLGMASKEVMLSAPLIVVLYDRAFLTLRWRDAWAMPARRRLYIALFACCGVSVGLIAAGARGNTVGFDTGVPWPRYFYSQAWAIWRYLQLTFWPAPLNFDYGRHLVTDFAGVPGLLGLSAAFVATVLAWRRRATEWIGFIGAWFFLLLAPSSSVVPIRTEIAAERRVYLALAAVILLVVVSIEHARRRALARAGGSSENGSLLGNAWFMTVPGVAVIYILSTDWTATQLVPESVSGQWLLRAGIAAGVAGVVACLVFTRMRGVRVAATAAIVIGMMTATFHRSAMYQDLEGRWTDAIAKLPTNGRAYDNLAAAELREDPPRLAAADSVLHRAMRVDSMYVPARVRSAGIAISQARLADAESLLTHALLIHPRDAAATARLGQVLLAQGHPNSALPYIREFADFNPSAESLTRLGLVYLMTRNLDSATRALKAAAALDTNGVDARRYLAAVLVEQERGAEALPYIRQAVKLDPADGIGLGLLSLAYAQSGDTSNAVRAADLARTNAGRNFTVYVFAGRALQVVGYFGDAESFLNEAIKLNANDPEALTRLGITEVALGRRAFAVRLFQRALAIAPGYPLAKAGLAELRVR